MALGVAETDTAGRLGDHGHPKRAFEDICDSGTRTKCSLAEACRVLEREVDRRITGGYRRSAAAADAAGRRLARGVGLRRCNGEGAEGADEAG